MQEQLLRVLQVDNPWLMGRERRRSRRLPEDYIERRLRLVPVDRVSLVVGPRQAGKSTLVWKTLATDGRPALYLDCEEPTIREWLRSPAAFLADLEELGVEVPILFFEEVQELEEAGLFLKGLVDRKTGRWILVTGSSSFDLESATRESLAGRARRHLLLPFSMREVDSSLGGKGRIHAARLEKAVERMLTLGSYPPVHTSSDPAAELAALVEAFVLRDASDRFRIRNTAAFRKVLELAASQIGNLCNFAEWASLAGVSGDTVAEYCRLLEETHVLRLLRPFVGGRRAEITRAPKAYFLDNGVRNQLFGGFRPLGERADRGALLENFVFTEVAKATNPLLDSLGYWRSKSGAEVDFVVERKGRMAAVEVKSGDARGRLSRSARSFIEAYRPERFLVVNRTRHEPRRLEETKVRFAPLLDLPDELEAFLEAGHRGPA